jgi:hypothetical protein
MKTVLVAEGAGFLGIHFIELVYFFTISFITALSAACATSLCHSLLQS